MEHSKGQVFWKNWFLRDILNSASPESALPTIKQLQGQNGLEREREGKQPRFSAETCMHFSTLLLVYLRVAPRKLPLRSDREGDTDNNPEQIGTATVGAV